MKNPLRNKKVLITAGPTWVALDSMRVITNRSSGQLAHMIARRCAQNNARVTLLRGPIRRKKDLKGVRYEDFTFFNELEALLRQELKKKYDIVIHAAAVSDYKPERVARSKIRSNLKRLRLVLVPTKKLIRSIKRQRKNAFLVGFKLESHLNTQRARRKAKELCRSAGCDLVVANSDRNGRYKGFIIDKAGTVLSRAGSREAIAGRLIDALKEAL